MGRCLATILLAVFVPLLMENSIFSLANEENIFADDKIISKTEANYTWTDGTVKMHEKNITYRHPGHEDAYRIIKNIVWNNKTKSNQINDTYKDSDGKTITEITKSNEYSDETKSHQTKHIEILPDGTVNEKENLTLPEVEVKQDKFIKGTPKTLQ
ncbi:uncharacterized protein LOC122509126 isoform X1 [Leptopilina heterotoma]|uniref:uncharacterized protein LOC122509126 isoform X1 n=1 Tax=Leptopilina heterotoma TaxID=63436 RepID=UPI001CA8F49A|nr:uncharacterized protein LOC122509126 isoform X1 [Leptopilina heterotoma]XP_043478863.1 uncharacterized protein LOC122509126 isoform X1 [Leptopilina heterotoma]